MSYEAPSFAEISRAIRASIKAELPQTEPAIYPNNLYVVCKALVPMFRGLFQRLVWLSKQAHVSTADREALEGFGADRGITPNPATLASGTVTAVTTIGTEIPAGTRLLRADDAVFLTLADVTATEATTTLEVAAEEVGKAGNTAADVTLTIETPIAGVGAVTVDADGLAGGANLENTASFRARILNRLRNPPHGGSPSEYQEWALQKPGVTDVFVRRATPAAGYVTIVFLMYDVYEDGIPLQIDIDDLKTRLEELAPSNAAIVTQAPVAVPINVTIADLVPDNETVQEAILDELKSMFRRRSEPGSAAAPFAFSRSWIDEAISAAQGETSHRLTAPADDVTLTEVSNGTPELATLGTVSFV